MLLDRAGYIAELNGFEHDEGSLRDNRVSLRGRQRRRVQPALFPVPLLRVVLPLQRQKHHGRQHPHHRRSVAPMPDLLRTLRRGAQRVPRLQADFLLLHRHLLRRPVRRLIRHQLLRLHLLLRDPRRNCSRRFDGAAALLRLEILPRQQETAHLRNHTQRVCSGSDSVLIRVSQTYQS